MKNRYPYFMFGARRLTRWMIFSPFTWTISDSKAFVRDEVRRRKWLLPPFVRIKVPDPVRRNRLEVALWVFSLIFPAFALRGTVELLSAESTRNHMDFWILQKATGLLNRATLLFTVPEFVIFILASIRLRLTISINTQRRIR
jgi:hypothetical protein